MYKKILVALDRASGAERALAVAGDLGRANGSVIRLLHVAPIPQAVMEGGRVLAYADQESERVQHETLTYLRGVGRRLTGFAVECAVRFGDPAEEILQEARDSGADLIAMATHGRTGVARLLLGSVAEAVLRQSEIPVVLVRHSLAEAA